MLFKISLETDYRELVRTAYDRCARDYAGQRRTTPEPELNLITKHLILGSKILDVGCGAGIPVARHLAETVSLTGVDISKLFLENIAHCPKMVVGFTILYTALSITQPFFSLMMELFYE